MNEIKQDQQWLTDFVLELSHQGVDGRSIGDAKASVESHLADSGESAEEAFGDPVAYAHALELPTAPEPGFPRILIPALLGILGLVIYFPSISAATQREPVSFSGVEFAMFLVLGLTMLLVAKNIFTVVKKWWVLLAIWLAVVGLGILASVLPRLLGLPLWEVSVVPASILSGALIIGAGFWIRASINSSEGIVRLADAGVPEQETAVERVMVATVPWLMTIGAGIFTAGSLLI
ncbi:hypothetical protein [Arthrobacter sp. H20]|uniref:hypothetical protein n=1 Tax=Arthrobacter sp. H20 TaxID=1267981 RepID=UPI00047A8276|nr:hypothetical protein [Arthrobacter sp. H20]